ncbi:MAG: AEC family transporter [Lachnospiraceae bacterium]|nr:AEC family transporter [Lachnospiraceae bacterium]
MLHNLYITFSVVFPFMAYLALGMLLRRCKVLDEHTSVKMNRFVALILFPFNLFNAIYQSDLGSMVRQPTVLYVTAGILLSISFLMLTVPRLEKDLARQGAMVHCGFRTNATLFALAVSEGIFGEDVPEVAVILVLAAVINNIVSVPLLEHYQRKVLAARGESAGKRTSIGALLLGWFKNPLLIGVIAGILWNLLGIPMPAPCAVTVKNIAACAIPIAFIMLGSRLNLQHLKANRKNVLEVTIYKLILLPAVAFVYPILAGWSPQNLVAMLVAFGTPTAIITYVTTGQYDCDGEMAGEIISVSTVFSMFTIFLWLFGLKQAGLI